MKETKDSQLIYEAYKSNQQPLLEYAAILARLTKFLPQIWDFIKSRPEIIQQIIEAIPALSDLLTTSQPVTPSLQQGPAPATPLTGNVTHTGSPPVTPGG